MTEAVRPMTDHALVYAMLASASFHPDFCSYSGQKSGWNAQLLPALFCSSAANSTSPASTEPPPLVR